MQLQSAATGKKLSQWQQESQMFIPEHYTAVTATVLPQYFKMRKR
jgi:hypothetical protein